MRVKRGMVTKRRHKKVLEAAKGYRWGRSDVFRLAKNAVAKAGQNAYIGRKNKKRDYRTLWIARISAAVRTLGLNFSQFQAALTKKSILLNRKILADLAARDSAVFEKVVQEAKK